MNNHHTDEYIWGANADLIIKNIDGPPHSSDFLGVKYKHYAVKGGYDKMDKLICGLVFAYQAIKPEGETIGTRPVYLVWRSKPRENLPIDGQDHSDEYYKNHLWTDCRFNIYTQSQYEELLSYHFFVEGLSFESEQDAWESFYERCEHVFEWTKGVKAWRTAPAFFEDKSFNHNDTEYRVVARVIACKELPKGWPEAIVRGPYDMSHMERVEKSLPDALGLK